MSFMKTRWPWRGARDQSTTSSRMQPTGCRNTSGSEEWRCIKSGNDDHAQKLHQCKWTGSDVQMWLLKSSFQRVFHGNNKPLTNPLSMSASYGQIYFVGSNWHPLGRGKRWCIGTSTRSDIVFGFARHVLRSTKMTHLTSFTIRTTRFKCHTSLQRIHNARFYSILKFRIFQ